MTEIKPQPGIMDIELYVGGKSHLDGIENVLKLSSNENPLGPSPLAQEAFAAQAGQLHRYPDSGHGDLRDALGQKFGLDPELIIVGNGSDEILSFITQSFCGPGDEVIFTEHGFMMYRICTLTAGATPVVAAENERQTDVDNILDAVTENTKIVFIANPNNPTGTMIGPQELTRLCDGLPAECVLVIDAAYTEYADGFDGGAGLVAIRDNVIMTRTFSKLFGLGGVRLGWAYAPKHIIDILNRVRGPFNVNSGALAAGLAALADDEHIENSIKTNASARKYLKDALEKIEIDCDASFGNFVLARFDSEEQADAADEELKKNGIIVRQVKGYNLPHCLRITVGRVADCSRVVSVLKSFKFNRGELVL